MYRFGYQFHNQYGEFISENEFGSTDSAESILDPSLLKNSRKAYNVLLLNDILVIYLSRKNAYTASLNLFNGK